MDAKAVLKLIKDKDIKIVDFKFMDFVGQWQHFSVPSRELKEDSFEDGYGFDGSSIRGWQAINESDMVMLPDPATAFVDPFTAHPTISLTCSVIDPITRQPYTRDPRNVSIKAEEYLKSTGIADSVYIGPEAEFFIFSSVRYGGGANYMFHEVDSPEGIWTSEGDAPNLGHKPRHKEGYFPVSPTDSLQDIRTEMVLLMEELGINIEAHHHEVATGGQCEIDMRFEKMTHMGDQMNLYKYVVKNVAKRHGMTATFMPKPLFEDNGSGMHTHISLWKGDTPLFAGDQYAGLSETCLHFIGGILKHAPSVIAFAAPTVNSYKRLVPGYEAPVNLAYSQRNRSACCRIPMYSASPKAKRVEFRCPDPSANPYYAFSALMMAGLDGIQNKIDPGDPLDKDIYDLPPEELALVPQVPASLQDALKSLEADHEFLLKGDVFTEDVISTWINYKMENEVMPILLRPHPHEFFMYYDI